MYKTYKVNFHTYEKLETNLFGFYLHKEVRAVANDGSNWILDPYPLKGDSFLEVLDFGKETSILINLGFWRTILESVGSNSNKTCAFFQYSMNIGRKIFGARSWKELTANVFWREMDFPHNISIKFGNSCGA